VLVAPHATALQATHDKGWILLTFAIFNTYMLILSTQVSTAVFAVFLTLELTEVVGFIGCLGNDSATIKASVIIGVVTAVVAWYASAAGVSNGIAAGRLRFPAGPPLIH
jgi:uncharacterized protein